MRTRAKALTVAVAMVTTFAILPALGAAAAEPLQDGSYTVAVGDSTYTVAVVDGVAVVDETEGVAFAFVYDEGTGRVLDEFDVTVDGVAYDVVVADDGTVSVTAVEGDGSSPDDTVVEEDGTGTEAVEEDGTEGLEESDDLEEAGDAAHGELVSTVAECAPNGRDAREAGLPNHGFFVRAAAHGQDVEFELDGEAHVAALSTQEGADAFCALVVGVAPDSTEESTDQVVVEEPTLETAEAHEDAAGDRSPTEDRATQDRGKSEDRGKAGDRGKGRASAPGQQGREG